MSFSQVALFVVDVQHDLALSAETEIPHAARIKDVGSQILKAARGADNQPLIVVVQHEDPPHQGSRLIKGSEPWKVFFAPVPDSGREILVAKTTRE